MSAVPIAEKGVNRCDAISYQEVLDQDALPAPAFMRSEAPRDLGVAPVSALRYTSQAFFDREVRAVWHRTWQFACLEAQLPEPGDTRIYEVAGRSAIIVRQRDGSLKAMQNVCLHRGRKLVTRNGCHSQFRCPYHGFAWKIDGSFRHNPMKWDFPQIDEATFTLPEIRVGSWGGFVFVNFDTAAPPLDTISDPMPAHFAHWQIRDCYQSAHVARVVPVNWKASIEAFLESHHVTTTHPQITSFTGDANAQYDVLSDHVCRFIAPLGIPSPSIGSAGLTSAKIVENWFAKGSRTGRLTEEDGYREGQSPRDFAANVARRTLTAQTGKDYRDVAETDLVDSISYQMFPAFGLFGGVGRHIGYRWRPWDNRPDRTLMEIFLFSPQSAKDPQPPAEMRLLRDDEPWSAAEELGYLGGVIDQDQANFGPLQQGLEALGDGVIQFGRYSEVRCRNLHRMVDRYIEEFEG